MIVGQGGSYLFTIKGNQRKLCREIDRLLGLLDGHEQYAEYTQTNTGHGRCETRYIQQITAPDALKKTWSHLQNIGTITRNRVCNKTQKSTTHKAYFITSLQRNPQDILHLNRQHWAIENNLHRNKDTLMLEDLSTIRMNNAPQNMAICRATALTFLKSLNKPLTHLTQHFARNFNDLANLL